MLFPGSIRIVAAGLMAANQDILTSTPDLARTLVFARISRTSGKPVAVEWDVRKNKQWLEFLAEKFNRT